MKKPEAIVYTSNTGFTKRYADMLSEITGLKVYDLADNKELAENTPIIYCGWLFASNIKGYKKAAKRFNICAVVGVGLCETGALLAEVRKAISLPETTPLFTVQGGMYYDRLKGINKFMIKMLRKGMSAKKDKTEDEERMFNLIMNGGDFVSKDNLAKVIDWYEENNR